MGNKRVTFAGEDGTLVKKDNVDFDPWGVRLNGTDNSNSLENRFKYQDKESLALFGLENVNDFSARYLDKSIGRFWGVDALAEKMPNMATYNYNFNNPLMFIDEDGNEPIPFDDFILTKNGTIARIKITNDKFDRLISKENPENILKLSKNVLNRKVVDINQTNFSYNDAHEIFVTGNIKEAKLVFEFAAENSNVEFQLATVEKKGDNVSLLRTDHRPRSVMSDHLPKLENAGFKVIDLKHSHPGGPGTPSGFDEFGRIDLKTRSQGDRKMAERYPEAIHKVYDTKTKKYTRYDKSKIFDD